MRVLIGQGSRKALTGKVTGSVEAPLPSGYSRHHERAGSSQMGQQHQAAAGRLPPDPTGVASALTESHRSLYPYRCGYLLGTAGERLSRAK
jgi:hypothetical protein